MEKKKRRIEWIDAIRGFAMILVIMGHCAIFNDVFRFYIYSFHMPLFFFITGMTINTKIDFKKYVIKKAKALLIPLYIYSIINFIFYQTIYNYLLTHNIPKNMLLSYIPGFIKQGKYSLLWFLSALFLAEIIYYIIVKANKSVQIIIIVCGVIVSFIYKSYVGVELPWDADIVFIIIFFIWLGNNISIAKLKLKGSFLSIILFFGLLFAYINVYEILNGKSIDLATKAFGNYILYMTTSILGTIFWVCIFNRFDIKNKILSKIGKNSVHYYALHTYIVLALDFISYHIVNKVIPLDNFFVKIIIGSVYAVVNIILISKFVDFKNIIYSKIKERCNKKGC